MSRMYSSKNFRFQAYAYVDLINNGTIPRSMHMWKTKLPLQIKIFMWFVHWRVILTKDNLGWT